MGDKRVGWSAEGIEWFSSQRWCTIFRGSFLKGVPPGVVSLGGTSSLYGGFFLGSGQEITASRARSTLQVL